MRAIHGAHPARAEARLEPVAPAEHGRAGRSRAATRRRRAPRRHVSWQAPHTGHSASAISSGAGGAGARSSEQGEVRRNRLHQRHVVGPSRALRSGAARAPGAGPARPERGPGPAARCRSRSPGAPRLLAGDRVIHVSGRARGRAAARAGPRGRARRPAGSRANVTALSRGRGEHASTSGSTPRPAERRDDRGLQGAVHVRDHCGNRVVAAGPEAKLRRDVAEEDCSAL